MARFQILSLIGGGIRGSFITSFLKELEQKNGTRLGEHFDLIAGTSTGGIIAAGLAAGKSAEELHEFYVKFGRQIFTPRGPYEAKGVMKSVFPWANRLWKRYTGQSLDPYFQSRYCPHALVEAFNLGFGSTTLADVRSTRLIIPTVNLTKGRPHIFRSSHLAEAAPDQDIRISDVLVAATAAPTYFPHKEIKGEVYADGGLWAADPSSQALAEAVRVRRDCDRGECEPTHELTDVHLLSVGTGRSNFSLTPPGADAGVIYWAQRAADTMGTAQTAGIHESLKFWLGNRYHHVNFAMDEKFSLDDVDRMPDLFELGRAEAKRVGDSIRAEFLHHERTQFLPHLGRTEQLPCSGLRSSRSENHLHGV